jgi:hypothetical protein
MGQIFLGLLGIGFSFALIKYREQVGDMLGDPEWASKVGGIYNIVILLGAIGFFWSIAHMTGTEDVLFAPLVYFLPHHAPPQGIPGTEF